MKKRAPNAKPERNEAIITLHRIGWKDAKLSAAFEITVKRVRDIVYGVDWGGAA
jgi:hypothetical protein